MTAAVSGAIAISAMILPGLSGSLVLILLGQYGEAISAVSGLRTLQLDYFAFLIIMSLGMLIGILAFARLLSFVFKRFYDGTVAFMIGLTFGSLYALWPFKRAVVMDMYEKIGGAITLTENAVVRTNANIVPIDIMDAVFALICAGVGAGVMVVVSRFGEK